MPSADGKTHFRPDIAGLRAVAVAAVVLFHAEVPGVQGGYVGVDVFFVISGFLITGLLWREASSSGTVRLGKFYGARARRLLPASALVGAFIMLSAYFMVSPLEARAVIHDGIASALYVSNYVFASQGVNYLVSDAPPSPFLHYWSLGVEEQFYLVWAPMFLGVAWLVRRRRTQPESTPSQRPYLVVLALVAVASFALSLAVTQWAPPVAFFSLPTRAWQLALGGLVALTAGQWRRLPPRAAALTGWTGLIVIGLACGWLTQARPYPGTAALLPTVGTVLVIGAGCALPARGCGYLLGLRPMRWLGRISYSLYLWHWPLLLTALAVIAPVTGHAALLGAGAVALSVGLAVLTVRYVEDPLRYAPAIRTSPRRSLAVGGVATAVVVCLGVSLHIPDPVGDGPPASALTVQVAPVPPDASMAAHDAAVRQAFAQVQTAVVSAAGLGAVPSNLTPSLADAAQKNKQEFAPADCFLSYFDVDEPECAAGDTESPTTVALIGDSNAAMWYPALNQLAGRRQWRLETMTKSSCPMLDLPISNPSLGREYFECERWRTQVVARLQVEHPKLIVLSVLRRYGVGGEFPVGFTSYESAWLTAMTRLLQQLRATGAQVLLLGPIPTPASSPVSCLSVYLRDAKACAPARSAAVNEAGIVAEAAAAAAGGGSYADITELFCTTQRCPVIVGNTLVYVDRYHVTIQFARVLAPAIGALADRALAQAS